ncbi:unnamed protein product, partial [Rangifer tarandus platyrhynchus]
DDLPREHTSWQRISAIPPQRRGNTRSASYRTLTGCRTQPSHSHTVHVKAQNAVNHH